MSDSPADEEPTDQRPADGATADEEDDDALLIEALSLRQAGRTADLERLLQGDPTGELAELLRLQDQLADLGRILEPPADWLAPLTSLGKYRRLDMIGRGGQSEVYRAHDPDLGRDVAVKVLLPHLASQPEAVRWMRSEGRKVARVAHGAVVRVYEVDEADGRPFVTMEHVDGPSLLAVLDAMVARQRGIGLERHSPETLAVAERLTPMPARLGVVLQVARALEACHQNGVVHRDVKPGNLLLTRDGAPKLIDFGLAHGTGEERHGYTQELVGTPTHLAPEQVDSGQAGSNPLSDQFSLGIVLYELLTLQSPFRRPTREQTLTAISAARCSPPSRLEPRVSLDAERVCLHCLERDPARRYPSMTALAADLEAILDLRSISLRGNAWTHQLGLWFSRHRRTLSRATFLTVAVLAVTVGAWGVRARGRAADQRARLAAIEAAIPTVADATAVAARNGELTALLQEVRAGRGIDPTARLWSLSPERVLEVGMQLAARTGSLLEAERIARPRSAPKEIDELNWAFGRMSRWSPAVTSEVVLLGERAPNRSKLEVGYARLPEFAEMTPYLPTGAGCYSFQPPSPADRVPVGRFRVVRSGPDGLLLETVVEVRPWDEPTSVELRPPQVELQPLGRPATFRYSKDNEELKIDFWPFALAERDVDEETIKSILGKWPLNGMTGSLAERCARKLGCRLPTVPELLLALQLGKLDEAGWYWTDLMGQHPEFGRTIAVFKAGSVLPAHTVEDYEAFTTFNAWNGAVMSASSGSGVRLRLAHSLDTE